MTSATERPLAPTPPRAAHADADPAPPLDEAPAPDRPGKWLALAAFVAAVMAAAGIGSRFSPARPDIRAWYRGLAKPPFQPPDAAFGPVWSVLYTTIAISGWRVWRRPSSPARTRALALWGTQLAANAAWTPVFFGAKKPKAALGVLATQLTTATAYAANAERVDLPAAAMVMPYLGWTAFAGALNVEIIRRNPS